MRFDWDSQLKQFKQALTISNSLTALIDEGQVQHRLATDSV